MTKIHSTENLAQKYVSEVYKVCTTNWISKKKIAYIFILHVHYMKWKPTKNVNDAKAQCSAQIYYRKKNPKRNHK